MIRGLIVTVGGKELIKLVSDRAAHHFRRAKEYAEQANRFGADDEDSKENTSNSSPRQTLVAKATSHADQAAEMSFIAAHLVADESYQLDRQDLSKLGIIKSAY